jgi:hypothetical protein
MLEAELVSFEGSERRLKLTSRVCFAAGTSDFAADQFTEWNLGGFGGQWLALRVRQIFLTNESALRHDGQIPEISSFAERSLIEDRLTALNTSPWRRAIRPHITAKDRCQR